MVTAVFVHGNPETAAIWSALLEELARPDVLTLSPPGFGAPLPAGFGGTVEDYGDWLVGELETVGEPVDLVGHDWGGGHVLRAVMRRPDLVRSWAVDLIGVYAPDYVWHDMAQVWQTPGAGEDAVAAMVAMPLEQRTSLYESLGMAPTEAAREVAAGTDEAMAACILSVYRSAPTAVMTEMGSRLPLAARRPGLVLRPADDPYTGTSEQVRWGAARAGAQVRELAGVGHWWMMQDPVAGAGALEAFWAALA